MAMLKPVRVVSLIGFIALCILAWTAKTAVVMPNFARQSSEDCTGCHTVIPRLNEDGFQYRKAGFRHSGDLGKDMSLTFANTFAARIQARADYQHHDDAGKTTNNSQITLHEITLYPLTGAFGKHYGSMIELSFLNEDFAEIENAYFRYSSGSEESWFSGRIGIFHPFEGYGASDRPISLARPLIQTETANQNRSTLFTPWNFDQAGAEAAYVHGRTSLSATIFNGIYYNADEGKAFPAAGGELQKPKGFENSNSKDFQLFANQILKEDGSGISGYAYFGQVDLPRPGVTAFVPDSSFGNAFTRLAGYASWMFTPKIGLFGGYQWGQDHYFDVAAGNADQTFNNTGWFGEVDAPVAEHLAIGGRYDFFDPSNKIDDNEKTAVTVFANSPLNDGLQGVLEYRHIQKRRGAVEDLKDDNLQVRVIWIW
jgi:hypothetical protein